VCVCVRVCARACVCLTVRLLENYLNEDW